jgi:transcriptional regulator with XRE-family HTH domain
MTPLLHIRKNILGLTQSELAVLCGVRQATVSRWESGESEPDRSQMEAIRGEAIRRGVSWNDALFFAPAEVPA